MRRGLARAVGAALALATCLGGAAFAHDGVIHKTPAEALAHQAATANTAGFPTPKGGDFTLVNQFGETRRSADPNGRFQMVFFGYVQCQAICSVALPRMAEAVDLLSAQGLEVTPILITVDPQRDTPEALAAGVPLIHPKLIGLTGSDAALNAAYRAFNVEKSVVFEDPEHGPVYAHGSFIYLLDPGGAFETLLPPILSPERMAEVVAGYVRAGQ